MLHPASRRTQVSGGRLEGQDKDLAVGVRTQGSFGVRTRATEFSLFLCGEVDR